jgi:hypothetical protein
VDVHEGVIPGPPGIRYEATPGRKTPRSTTFIGRVYERVDGGGMQLWACDHKHPDQVQARDCAVAEANAIAARALADYRPPDIQALRDAVAQEFGGTSAEFRDPG